MNRHGNQTLSQDFTISPGRKYPLCRYVVFVLLCLAGTAKADNRDSTTQATFVINPRLHSAGYFPFTGTLLNHNPVLDVNVFYEKKMFGFFVFQSIDLADPHSYVNYLQPGVFAKFNVQPNLRVRAFFGYLFSQGQGFRDADSDYYAAATIYWDLSKQLRVENTGLFYDYNISKKFANRLLVGWTSEKFRIDCYLWYRAALEEKEYATSGAVAFTFPRIKVNRKVSVQLTSTYMRYFSAERPDYALEDGFFFTLAVPVTPL